MRLSDCEAYNFGAMELFVLALLGAALARGCSLPGSTAGDVLTVFGYVLMFVSGMDTVPSLVRQVSRVRDICRRAWHDRPTG